MTIAKCKQCDCGKERIIVNKHFFLCQHKNQERLDSKKQSKPQQDKIDVQALKKKYSINKLSNTKRITCHDGQVVSRAELKTKLHSVYVKIDNEREPICQGCGKNTTLSHSHIISRSLREDLITDPDNIQLHCSQSYDSCHEKWERFVPWEVIEMKDFQRNMMYVETVDRKLFQKLMAKLEYSTKNV